MHIRTLAVGTMHQATHPRVTCTSTQSVRAPWRPSLHTFDCAHRQIRICRHLSSRCEAQQGKLKQQAELQRVKHKLWPSVGVLSPLVSNPTAARADEVTTAAGGAAQAAAEAAADLAPTVTFGGSFGQYDPIIAFFFYAVIATLTVLTLGVSATSILARPLIHVRIECCICGEAYLSVKCKEQ